MALGARLLVLVTALLGTSRWAEARYVPPSFPNLAGASDVVVLGTIVEVDPVTFTLRAEEVLAGSVPGTDLVIRRFRNWECSRRWKPYAVGQREICFLQALSTEDARETRARYSLRSAGAEGEWEIEGDRVSVQGFRVPGGVAHDEGEHPGQWLPLGDVLDALRTYRRCFSVFPNPTADWAHPVVHVVCDPGELEEFRKRSVVHNDLARVSIAALTSGPNR